MWTTWFDLTDPLRLDFTLAWVDPNAKAPMVLGSVACCLQTVLSPGPGRRFLETPSLRFKEPQANLKVEVLIWKDIPWF